MYCFDCGVLLVVGVLFVLKGFWKVIRIGFGCAGENVFFGRDR